MESDDSDPGYLPALGSGALEGAAATMQAAGEAGSQWVYDHRDELAR